MVRNTSLLRHESPCLPLKILNKTEERRNYVGKTLVIFPCISGETLGAPVRLVGITKV